MGARLHRSRHEVWRQDHGADRRRPGVRPEPDEDRQGRGEREGCQGRLRAKLPAGDRRVLRHGPGDPRRSGRYGVRLLLSAGLGGPAAGDQRDRHRRQREAVRRRHGRPAVRGRDGIDGLAAQRRGELQLLAAREVDGVRRHQRVLRQISEACRRGEGRSAGLLPRALRLRDGPDGRAGGQLRQVARPEEDGRLPAQQRDGDDRRADRLRTGRRAQGIRDADGAVPWRRRQERRAVPQPGQADHPVPRAALNAARRCSRWSCFSTPSCWASWSAASTPR
jgi:hypothetical protein